MIIQLSWPALALVIWVSIGIYDAVRVLSGKRRLLGDPRRSSDVETVLAYNQILKLHKNWKVMIAMHFATVTWVLVSSILTWPRHLIESVLDSPSALPETALRHRLEVFKQLDADESVEDE